MVAREPNSKLPFQIDLLGATISAISLGLVLPQFENLFGIPNQALYILASIPLLFIAYDFIHILLPKAYHKMGLRGIALLNLGYCFFSIWICLQHALTIKPLGWIYILGEIVIIFCLASWEWRFARELENTTSH